MDPIKQIDVHKVKELEDNDSATIVDIRDPSSFKAGHIPNAIHLSDGTVKQFIIDTDKKKTANSLLLPWYFKPRGRGIFF